MTLLQSLQLPMGSQIINFNLPATDGNTYTLTDFSDKEILIIIFMCNHCPYVHAIINRLISIQSDYSNKGVQLIGINSNDSINYPDDSFEAMQKWVTEKVINFVYLHDEDQSIAKAYKAQCTPDIYMFDKSRQLVYHGQIDDNWKDKSNITKHDLRDAINASLAGVLISKNQSPTIGCSIKWK